VAHVAASDASPDVSFKRVRANLIRFFGLLLLSLLALQLYFFARVALMRFVDPQSTSFQRSEIARLFTKKHTPRWKQQWRPYSLLSASLKRAVIAAEDAGFTEHTGLEWDALEKAWQRNQRAEARAEQANARAAKRPAPYEPNTLGSAAPKLRAAQAKMVGASTITQQLAKNLFLSSERNFLRKSQELAITFMLEGLLSKKRILEIYLNNVEWGEGVFGAQAAAQHYFRVDASQLNTMQAARLAVMLPAPKRFEKNSASAYVIGRAATIAARMSTVDLP